MVRIIISLFVVYFAYFVNFGVYMLADFCYNAFKNVLFVQKRVNFGTIDNLRIGRNYIEEILFQF